MRFVMVPVPCGNAFLSRPLSRPVVWSLGILMDNGDSKAIEDEGLAKWVEDTLNQAASGQHQLGGKGVVRVEIREVREK